MMASENFER